MIDWTLIGALAGVGSLVVALLAYYAPARDDVGLPPSAPRSSAPGTTSPAAATTGPAPVASSSGGGPVTGRYLSDVVPTAGALYLDRTRPRPPRALVLECPTNQSDDQVREVEFPLRGAYETFTAVAVVSAVPDPAVRTQVDVFTVDEDGHALRPVNRVLTGNARAPLDTPVRQAHALRLRVRCESSAAVITVLSPRVTA